MIDKNMMFIYCWTIAGCIFFKSKYDQDLENLTKKTAQLFLLLLVKF